AQAAYLYGAPAAGNRFLAELSYEHPGELVEAHKGFRFGDPGLALPRPSEAALDTRLDAQGQVQTELALPEDLPGQTPVAVFIRGSVFESGGRAVSRTIKQTTWPASHLVGIRPLFDVDQGAPANSEVAFELLRSDADAALAAGTVQISLMRDRQDVIWSHDPELGWRVDYHSNWERVGTAQTLALEASGAGRFQARVEWGSYRLDVSDEQTGLISRLPFHAGWRGAASAPGDAPRPDRVAISLDQAAYRAGDTAVLTLTPPHPGPGLLLVEAGQRLLASRRIDVDTGTRLELAIEPDWERHDIHITALVFRPGSAAGKIAPNRALGIVYLPIDRSQRQLAVDLAAVAQARPGEELSITVSVPELAGQQAMATVSAVDQGIVNITRYPVPDAAGHFFAARAHQVDAHDVYGRVVEHYDGHRASLRFGGDMALASLPQARRPTAKIATVDLFSGPVQLDADGRASVRFTLPDFNGQLRLAALVWTGERYGHATDTVQVRAPLVAEVSSPRVMAPGDRSQLSLDLHNLSGQTQTLSLRVQAQPPLALAGGERRLQLVDNERQVLQFPLSALPGFGVGRLSVQVNGEGIDLQRQFELVVRPGWASARSSQLLERSAPAVIVPEQALLSGYLPGSGILATSLSRQAPIPFASAVDGLIGYPYGCLEQTTSRAFPLALLDDESARRLGIETLAPGSRQQALETAFSQLSGMQLASGHFSFWPGEHRAQTQLTPFVAELLIEARDAGQVIPEQVLDKALERLNEDLLAGGDRYHAYDHAQALSFAVRAHAGYVLARQGRAPLGTLRALHEHERGQARSLLSLVHLGLALHLQGDTARGRDTLDQAFTEPPTRPRYLGDYGSELRDRALALALLRQHGVEVAASGETLLTVARLLAGQPEQRHLTTQEQLAVFRLGRQLDRAESLPLAGEVLVGDERMPIPSANLYSRQFDQDDLAAGVRLEVAGSGPLQVLHEAVGLPRSAPAPVESGISIRRDWFRADGTPFRGDRLQEGDSLIVRLSIQAQEQTDDLLVVDHLPGGLEAENLNLADSRLLSGLTVDGVALDQRYGTDIRHEEYRDDRYVAALRLWPGQTGELWYIARAVSPGQFNVPPPQAEDMYRPDLRAVGSSPVPRLTVTAPE
ncbi:MAG: alpha-2-macroglobulin family protein, partial [Lysobacterales bacterium]